MCRADRCVRRDAPAPEHLLYLDIKTADLDQLVALIHEFGVAGQIIFTSERYPLIQAWRKKLPSSHTSDLEPRHGRRVERKARHAPRQRVCRHHAPASPRPGGRSQFERPVHTLDGLLEGDWRGSKDRGIVFQILPWECSNREAYVKLLELGAASFATDYPAATLAAVEQFQRSARKP